jgi:cytochrome c-type biogenesis protein CcmH
MILFWLICAGLVAIALAFILPTLLQRAPEANEDGKKEATVEIYRDQLRELDADLANGIVGPEQYARDRDEIEQRLLDDVAVTVGEHGKPVSDAALKRWGAALWVIGIATLLLPRVGLQFRMINLLTDAQPTVSILLFAFGAFFLFVRSNKATAYALALAIPVVAVAIYLNVGVVRAIEPGAPATENRGMTQPDVEANLAALAKRLEQNPADANGWAMLARSYIELQRYSDASNAYAKATALKSEDAELLTEYAFAMAMANGRSLQGQPTTLLKRALQIAPENPRTLELAGSAEFEAKNYKQAIAHWQKLVDKSAGNPELIQTITARINEAKSLSGTNIK